MPETTASWQRGRGVRGWDDLRVDPSADVDVDIDLAGDGDGDGRWGAAGGAPGRGGAAPSGRPVPAGGARGLVLALALAVAASTATGLVVQHRATLAAAAEPPRIEVGYPEVRPLPARLGSARARIVLPVLNTGERPVTVTSLELSGRAGPVHLERDDVELAPGEQRSLAVEATPRCHSPATGEPDVASLAVRAADGRRHTVTTELAAPFDRPALATQLHGVCTGSGEGRGVEVAVSLLPDRQTLVLRMTNTSPWPTDLSLWAPSASGIVSDPPLPRELAAGAEVSLSLTAGPRCETWSGGLPSMSVDVVSSRPPVPDGVSRSTDRDVPSGWSALLTSWLGGQVTRTCDAA